MENEDQLTSAVRYVNSADHIANADRWTGDRHADATFALEQGITHALISIAASLERITNFGIKTFPEGL